MANIREQIGTLLTAYLETEDRAALERAGQLARNNPLDIDALLAWVDDYGATPRRTSSALRRLRFILGLPVIAGAVCRSTAAEPE